MDTNKRSLIDHEKYRGKLEILSRMPVSNLDELSIAYSPGVGAVSSAIAENPELAKTHTMAGRTVLVVSDGSAVLGLGNIGAKAALPVMEGKWVLMKEFADVDAIPLVLSSQDPDKIIETIVNVAPTFAGVNLEDIKAPECFYIEQQLRQTLDIPVFHDDQHGTAIVVLAGLINAAKVVGKDVSELSIVINGAGAAGIAIAELLHNFGVQSITLLDSRGVVTTETASNPYKKRITQFDNYSDIGDDLDEAIVNKNVFIGVSKGNILDQTMINKMKSNPIVFALANPDPEIAYGEAQKSGVAVLATGRSDYPNQVNNVLAFPGIFRGMINNQINEITMTHKLHAANAIAELVVEPRADKILPDPFDDRIVPSVAAVIK